MGTEKKKLRLADEGTEKKLHLNKKKMKVKASHQKEKSNLYHTDEENGDNQKGKLLKKRKANKAIASQSGVEKADEFASELDGNLSGQNVSQKSAETKTSKMRKKRRKDEKRKKAIRTDVEDKTKEENEKFSDAPKKKKKNGSLSRKEEKVEPEQNDVYEMSSGDEDSSRGMKKWITEYRQSRPGLKELQDQIDDFITAHEAQEEEARKEREAQAAEGGWTVVTHHKGRKKTTEAESGTVVGSVAPAAVMENIAKKKNKSVGTDFYRFQKREAHMNELMQLQSKFEQDKKRIQQMRAARKFRPY